jgi:hypothetical protein
MRCTHIPGTKKTTAESGLLLIEMGNNSSTAFLAVEEKNWTKTLEKAKDKSSCRSYD